jgi:hypothetical protein
VSLFDELDAKVRAEPSLRKHNLARVDMSMLMFSARSDVRALWQAASDDVKRARDEGREPSKELVDAVAKLKPIFGQLE